MRMLLFFYSHDLGNYLSDEINGSESFPNWGSEIVLKSDSGIY